MLILRILASIMNGKRMFVYLKNKKGAASYRFAMSLLSAYVLCQVV